MKERIQWIDKAKAIGIMLVIYGHLYPNFITSIIYEFHMPLFFFLSGLTLNLNHSFNTYFRKKVNSLLVPYFLYGIVRLVWIIIFSYFTHNSAAPSIRELSIGLFLCIRNSAYSVGLWFLPVLFFAEIYVYWISRLKVKNIYRDAVVVIVSVVGFIYARTICKPLVWGLDAVPICGMFIYLGSRVKNRVLSIQSPIKYVPISTAILFLVCILHSYIMKAIGYEIHYPDMYYGRYGFEVLYLICSLMGIFSTCLICMVFRKSLKSVTYIGTNTLHIYCIHHILIDIFFWCVGKTGILSIATHDWLLVLIDLIGVITITVVCYMYCVLLQKMKMQLKS